MLTHSMGFAFVVLTICMMLLELYTVLYKEELEDLRPAAKLATCFAC